MNALEDNAYTQAWREFARSMPRPRAILAVSAHWVTRGTAATVNARPPTIHDFGGFPPALYAMQYPAPGDRALVETIAALLAPTPVRPAEDWGLDHGTWSVLVHMYPDADIPVVQLSLDAALGGPEHVALAQRLRPLRDQGVLILGTGNLVHNLRLMDRSDTAPPMDWAVRFDAAVRRAVAERDLDSLAAPERFGREEAVRSIQGPEHYIPLLYAMAQQEEGEPVELFAEGVVMRSVSMTSVRVG